MVPTIDVKEGDEITQTTLCPACKRRLTIKITLVRRGPEVTHNWYSAFVDPIENVARHSRGDDGTRMVVYLDITCKGLRPSYYVVRCATCRKVVGLNRFKSFIQE